MDILTTDREFLVALKDRHLLNQAHWGTTNLDSILSMVCSLDATRYLRRLPSNSVWAIITDEPYAVFKRTHEAHNTNWKWDGVVLDTQGMLTVDSPYDPRLPTHLQTEWVFEASRVLKPGGALINFGHVEFTATFRDVCKYAGLDWKASGPWIKTTAMPSLTKKNFKSAHEHFFVASKGSWQMNYLEEQEMLNYLLEAECPRCGEEFPVSFSKDYRHAHWMKDWYEVSRNIPKKLSGHPTEKPEWLIAKMVNLVRREGEVVVDPFCGSGTTLAVAAQLGMKWAGNDYDTYWANYAQNRVDSIITFI